MADDERKTLNVYASTKEELNKIKELLQFKNEDQAVKFLISFFRSNEEKVQTLIEYINIKTGN